MKIKDLPIYERPIERLIYKGVDVLTDEELISIILKTGTKEKSVKEVSLELLSKYNLEKLKNISLEDIVKIKGIGKKKAATLMASIELGKRLVNNVNELYNEKINNSEKVFKYFSNTLSNKNQEHFYCLYLDNQKRVIKNKLLFVGTLNYSLVHPREIFKEAYLNGAISIICIHNHPSGDIKPSNNDIELTNNLINIGMLLGIKIDDHIIIGKDKYFSFYENNLM